jgi:hypothetical protein
MLHVYEELFTHSQHMNKHNQIKREKERKYIFFMMRIRCY